MDGSSFYAELQSIQHGLSNRDVSSANLSCFFFVGGYVYTYNEECLCRRKTSLPEEVYGDGIAVQAGPLMAVASKFSTDKELKVTRKDNHLVLSIKKRRGGVLIQQEMMTNPSEFLKVPKKGEWKPIPAELPLAVERVASVASRAGGANNYMLMCVHLTAKHVEASDLYQLARYHLPLPIEDSIIVRHEIITGVINLGASEMAVDSNWVYFKNRKNVIMAYSRYAENAYPDLNHILKRTGDPIQMPETMQGVVDKAQVMLNEVKDARFDVELRANECVIHGRGDLGFYSEKVAVVYDGEPISFKIAPKMLAAIASDDMHCEVKAEGFNNFLKSTSEDKKFVYMACLDVSTPDEE